MKPIKDFEDYLINTKGEIYSIKSNKILKWKYNKANGYYSIILSKQGKTKTFYIHRLVAQTFLDNPYNLPQVNHKDGNKQNNSVENLEWCNQSHNMCHAFDNGLAPRHTKKRDNQAPLNAKKGGIKQRKSVAVYDLSGKLFMIKEGIKNNNHCCERIAYKGMMYRYVDRLAQRYGYIPIVIPPFPECMKTSCRKIVKQYKNGLLVKEYVGYPKYSYSEIMKSIMYDEVDKNGFSWKIEKR